MRVLITGVTGYLGTRLSKALVDREYAVVGLSRDSRRAQSEVPWLEQAFEWQPAISPPSEDVFKDVDAVVHLAAEPLGGRGTAAKLRSNMEDRVRITRHLVEGIGRLASRPRVLIAANGTGYYADHGDDLITEETPAGHRVISRGALASETEAFRARDHGLAVATVRIGYLVGPGATFLAANLPFYKLGMGGPMGSGRQWWSWVHADDVIGIMARLLDGELDGAVNATSPEPVRQRGFARTLGRVLHRPAFLPTPGFAVKLVAGEFTEDLLGSKRVVPRRALDSGYEFRFPELEPALRDAVSRKQ